MNEIVTQTEGGLARITLNRPAALHALNEQMCRDMIAALLSWRTDESVRVVLIEHQAGTRGFCAGGDIRMLAESGAKDGAAARGFFHAEYRLNHLLFVYPKPVIVIMDGVTMGGGFGLAMPAPFRIATENTVFAMPETGIGLFPDVGGGWHLPRLPGKIGLWLALTGARLKAADCVAASVATHYAPSAKLDAVRALALAAGSAEHPQKMLYHELFEIDEDAGEPVLLTPENHARIAERFSCGSVEALMAHLAQDGSEWAQSQLAILKTKSPQTMKVAFRQLHEGACLHDFADNMKMEYRIAARVVMRHDFHEGVRAVIVEKDNAPRWDPASLAGVSEAMLDEIFAPLAAGQEWTPLPELSKG